MSSDATKTQRGGGASLLLLAMGGGFLVLIIAVILVASGYGFALCCWGTRPVPGDARTFRPLEHFDELAAYAGEGVALKRFQLEYVRPDGSMDLLASYGAGGSFEFVGGKGVRSEPVGAPPDLSQMYSVTLDITRPWESWRVTSGSSSYRMVSRGMVRSKGSVSSEPELALRPKCTLKQLWKAALERGAPANAVAHIEYSASGYDFSIETVGSLSFNQECQITSVWGRGFRPLETTP